MSRLLSTAALLLGASLSVSAQYTATYDPNNLPPTTEQGQTGTNQCGAGSNQTSQCQNLWVNSVSDFCLWSPPDPNSQIGTVEEIVVAWCTKGGRGTRVIPDGTLISAHFVETPDYIQVTGTGRFVNMNIQDGDSGGELDPHGADGNGNPHGGLVFSTVWNNGTNGLGEQIHEWTNFMSDQEYCIRVCKEGGAMATSYCQHVYDINGCHWNMPGNYDDGFDQCMGDSVIPMGLYPQADGTTSTYQPRSDPTPPAQNPAATSQCHTFTSAAIYAAGPTPTANTSGERTSTGAASGTGSGSHPTTSSPASTHSTGAAVGLGAGLPCSFAVTLIGLVLGAYMMV